MAVSSVAPYGEPEIMRTYRIPAGGEIRLEALSPKLGGPPIVRLVADFKVDGAQHTIERYVQVPYAGFDLLGPDAAEQIAADVRDFMDVIARRRQRAGRG